MALPNHRIYFQKWLSCAKRWGLLLPALLIGCAYPLPPVEETPQLVFPPAPAQARVQYLGAIDGPIDVEASRQGFAEFILGAEDPPGAMAKPIAATLWHSRLYVCDMAMHVVHVVDLAIGDFHRLAGDRGPGKVMSPNNLCVDELGRLYVADRKRGAVLVYSPDERFLFAWGRPGKVAPVAVAVAGENLYVCDMQDHEIEVWNRQTGDLVRTIGSKGREQGQFMMPSHLAVDAAGNLYVTDTGNFRVQKFSPEGMFLKQFGSAGQSPGRFAWPKGVGVDRLGRVYVADSRFANMQIFDAEGRLLLFFGGPGADGGNLDLPAGVSVVDWPSIPWLDQRVLPGFKPEFLVIVVNQWDDNLVNLFAVAEEEKVVTP